MHFQPHPVFPATIVDANGGPSPLHDEKRRECIVGSPVAFDIAAPSPEAVILRKPASSTATMSFDNSGRPTLEADVPGRYRLEIRSLGRRRFAELVAFPSSALDSPLFKSRSMASGVQHPQMYMRSILMDPACDDGTIALALEGPDGPLRGTGLCDELVGGKPGETRVRIAQYQVL